MRRDRSRSIEMRRCAMAEPLGTIEQCHGAAEEVERRRWREGAVESKLRRRLPLVSQSWEG